MEAKRSVFDCHVHAYMDHEKLNYTYLKNTLTDLEWRYSDYQKASQVSALPPDEFLFMSMMGLPKDQYLTQCKLAYENLSAASSGTQSPKLIAIVSTSDPTDENQENFSKFLDELITIPLVKGVRFGFNGNPSNFTSGVQKIETRKLTIDLLVTDQQALSGVYNLVKEFPNTNFVLDHLGTKGSAGCLLPDFAWWSPIMKQLSSLPNLFIKISGLSVQIPSDPVKIVFPYVELLVKEFGYERCIYNANWFVVNGQDGFWSYAGWAAAFVHWLEILKATDNQKDWILSKSAKKAYKLN